MIDAGGAVVMARPKRKGSEGPEDARVAAVVLKDTPEYRDWLTGLSEATLIPVATIVRDALAKWAAERHLPEPPGAPLKSQRRVGDRSVESERPKRGRKPE